MANVTLEQDMCYLGRYRDATITLRLTSTGCIVQLTRGALSTMRLLPLDTPIAALESEAAALYLQLVPRKGVEDA